MTQLIIADGVVVRFQYVLTGHEDKKLDEGEMSYLHGAGNIIPGLEAALTGQTAGGQLKVSVPPAEAYGERQEIPLQPVPRDMFPDGVEPQQGMMLMLKGPEDEPLPAWIANVQEDVVLVDLNHPLAGETLRFAVDVSEVRPATDEEKEHGHPHGPGECH
jgi:FKBP-type peptidyl-prolyl cis-trans isomerase SlyD